MSNHVVRLLKLSRIDPKNLDVKALGYDMDNVLQMMGEISNLNIEHADRKQDNVLSINNLHLLNEASQEIITNNMLFSNTKITKQQRGETFFVVPRVIE